MTREEAIRHIDGMINTTIIVKGIVPDEYDIEALRMAIEALKAKTDGDIIRKADAIDACCRGWNNTAEDCIRNINALPSAEPKTTCVAQIRIDRDDIEDMVNEKVNQIVDKMAEPKTGEWIEVEVFPEVYDIEGVKTWGSEMQCDQCGFRHTAIEGHMAQYNFCPNCGARMLGEDGEADETD